MSRAEKLIGNVSTIAPLAVVVLFACLMGEQERELLALRETVADAQASKAAACNLDQLHVLNDKPVHDQAEGGNKGAGLYNQDLARRGDLRPCACVGDFHLGTGMDLGNFNLSLSLEPCGFGLGLCQRRHASTHHRVDIQAVRGLLWDGFVQELASDVYVNGSIGGVQ